MAMKQIIQENHLSTDEARWFAVRTCFRDEKAAVKQLVNKGIECYLPIKKVTRRYSRRIRHVEMPLIHNFVFVKITKNQYNEVLDTQYVQGFLKLGGNLLAIPDQQIELMQRLLGDNIDIAIVPAEDRYWEKGDLVEVTVGPMLGHRGELVDIHGKKRLVIELFTSGPSMLIEIEAQCLKRVDTEGGASA